jgi:hypothetical protein
MVPHFILRSFASNFYAQDCMDKYNNNRRELENREIKSLEAIDGFPVSFGGGGFLDIGCGDESSFK